jgi:Ca2+/Na+ antiporter
MSLITINPSEVGGVGLIWLLLSYGYVLLKASLFISEGSDLLLLVPSLAGFVGGTILPLLGALPEGAIMLVSGLGDLDKAQVTLSVGIGTLAGSTIMLLTVPWILCVYAGRVDIVRSSPAYRKKPKLCAEGIKDNLFHTGVAISTQVRQASIVMMVTTIPYFLVQTRACAFALNIFANDVINEKSWIFWGFIFSMAGFVSYMAFQVYLSNRGADRLRRLATMKKLMKEDGVSLSAVLFADGTKPIMTSRNELHYQAIIKDEEVATIPHAVQEDLREVLRDLFHQYDRDKNGTLDRSEVKQILFDLNEHYRTSEKQVVDFFSKFDSDGDGRVDFEEFLHGIYSVITEGLQSPQGLRSLSSTISSDTSTEEIDDIPECLSHLPPEEQLRAIKRRALTMILLGAVLVSIFSDPVVDVLQEIAIRLNVSSFYVSFLLAPLASNAMEVISSIYFAAKKTRKSITISISALEGAATMNNTFGLSIMLGLIYFRGLVWEYTAETVAIVFVQLAVGILVLWGGNMTLLIGCLIFSLLPISLALVAGLHLLGFD